MKLLLQVITREDARVRGMARFYTGVPCKHGHDVERNLNNSCCECERLRSLRYSRENKDKRKAYAKDNHERVTAKRQQWARDNANTINRQKRSRYRADPEPHRERRRRYYADNREIERERWRIWRELSREYLKQYWVENREDYAKRSRLRRAQMKLATPVWLTEAQRTEMKYRQEEAKAISVDTGVLHHVDHIVPLQSNIVCGLHVPWNLRIITAQENAEKGNFLDQALAASL